MRPIYYSTWDGLVIEFYFILAEADAYMASQSSAQQKRAECWHQSLAHWSYQREGISWMGSSKTHVVHTNSRQEYMMLLFAENHYQMAQWWWVYANPQGATGQMDNISLWYIAKSRWWRAKILLHTHWSCSILPLCWAWALCNGECAVGIVMPPRAWSLSLEPSKGEQ